MRHDESPDWNAHVSINGSGKKGLLYRDSGGGTDGKVPALMESTTDPVTG